MQVRGGGSRRSYKWWSWHEESRKGREPGKMRDTQSSEMHCDRRSLPSPQQQIHRSHLSSVSFLTFCLLLSISPSPPFALTSLTHAAPFCPLCPVILHFLSFLLRLKMIRWSRLSVWRKTSGSCFISTHWIGSLEKEFLWQDSEGSEALWCDLPKKFTIKSSSLFLSFLPFSKAISLSLTFPLVHFFPSSNTDTDLHEMQQDEDEEWKEKTLAYTSISPLGYIRV